MLGEVLFASSIGAQLVTGTAKALRILMGSLCAELVANKLPTIHSAILKTRIVTSLNGRLINGGTITR